MSDDLKSRLRKLEGGDKYGSTVWYRNPDGPEAADRIEKLEADLEVATMKRLLDSDRIEKLEAALREIANGQRDADKSYAELLAEVRIEARKALEGKDD